MIQALKELGEQRLKMEGRSVSDLVSILVQDPNQKGNCPYALIVIFEQRAKGLDYKNVEIQPSSKDRVKKYLYRFKAPNGPDFTPTSRITDDINKTLDNKVKRWFGRSNVEGTFLQSFVECFNREASQIIGDIKEKFLEIAPSLERNQGCFITFAILSDSNLQYIGDYSDFQKLLIESVKAEYRKFSKLNHVCSVCGAIKGEVFGWAIPISFYTLDKPGYIAGGFREEDAWKNAPVCLECSLKLEEGKKFLDEYLQFRMGGARYYLLPKFILGEEAKEVVSDFFQTAQGEKQEVLAQGRLKRLSEDEQEILETIAELKDVMTFNFLFYQIPTRSTFRINLLVEDILPSRLSRIFKAKERAENQEIFKNIKMGKTYEDIEFRFSNLTRRPPNDIPSLIPSQKDFLQVVDKTFRGLSLDKNLLINRFMKTIRGVFANNGYVKLWALQAFVSLLFLGELGILPNDIQIPKGGGLMTALSTKAEEFFKAYPGTFNESTGKALFLLGVLTQKLLNIQFVDRNATPFRKHLKGFRMKEEDFRGLFPKIQSKLEEYGKNYYRKLEALISEYLLQAGRDWEISTDEANFYFVVGMSLEDKVSEAFGITKQKEEIDYE